MTDTTKTEALRLALDRIKAAGDPTRLSREDHLKLVEDVRAVQSWCNVDGLERLLAERDHYKARCEALTDDALSRVMDASEDELNAALKLEGKDPDDTARLAGQAIELALLTAERDRLAAECEALRADAERYRWLRDDPEADPGSLLYWEDESERLMIDARVDAAINFYRAEKEQP